MIIITGRYSDQSPRVCKYKSPEKIVDWFKYEFLEDDPDEDEGSYEVIKTILSGDPDMEIISNWFKRKDLFIDTWE